MKLTITGIINRMYVHIQVLIQGCMFKNRIDCFKIVL